MSKYVAFIGSRDLSQFPPEWIELYRLAVERCVQRGFAIRTGAAVGADQLGAEVALAAGGKVQLVLPWETYESEWIASILDVYGNLVEWQNFQALNADELEEWYHSVKSYHPAESKLTRGARILHARNYGIVKPAKCVVALPGLKRVGGTGQALRVAAGLHIPVFNLTVDADRERLQKTLLKPKTEVHNTGTRQKIGDFIDTFPENEDDT